MDFPVSEVLEKVLCELHVKMMPGLSLEVDTFTCRAGSEPFDYVHQVYNPNKSSSHVDFAAIDSHSDPLKVHSLLEIKWGEHDGVCHYRVVFIFCAMK